MLAASPSKSWSSSCRTRSSAAALRVDDEIVECLRGSGMDAHLQVLIELLRRSALNLDGHIRRSANLLQYHATGSTQSFKHQVIRRSDLPIDPGKGHLRMPAGHELERPARPQVNFAHHQRLTGSVPPTSHVFRLGPRLKDRGARDAKMTHEPDRVSRMIDDEVGSGGRGGCGFG